MEYPQYHDEVGIHSFGRPHTLSVDLVLGPDKDGSLPCEIRLSVWDADDYDPVAVIDLSDRDARWLANHLRTAADVLATGEAATTLKGIRPDTVVA